MKNCLLPHLKFLQTREKVSNLWNCFTFLFKSIVVVGVAFSLPAMAEGRRAGIINGVPSETPWPWMVSLAYAGGDLARGHFCGGILVDPRFVLTSAHCVADLVNTPEDIAVVLGRSNLTETNGIVVRADGIIIFPNFNAYTLQNDLALVRLSRGVPQYQSLRLISPHEAGMLAPEIQGLILGWGVTDPFVPVRPARLQEAWIPVISEAQCIDRLGIDFDPESMLCAGELSSTPFGTDGVDACYGDSGGPLMVQDSEGWKLLGITAWGFVCASDRYWGVYTKVAAFSDWVNSVLARALYATNASTITGTPVVGKRLRCHPGTFHGESTQPARIKWKDVDSGRYVSKGPVYLTKATDIGKTFQCETQVGNLYGNASSVSAPTGPVFPGNRSGKRFRIKGSELASAASVYCLGKNCSVVLTFRKPVIFAEGLIIKRSECSSSNCMLSSAWKAGVPLSDTSWRIPLKRGLRKPNNLLIFATVRNPEQDFVFKLIRT